MQPKPISILITKKAHKKTRADILKAVEKGEIVPTGDFFWLQEIS